MFTRNCITQHKLVNELMTSAKKEYFSTLVHNRGMNQRKLLGVVNKLLSHDKQVDLPNHVSMQSLWDDFGNFFKNKINRIQWAFTQATGNDLSNDLMGFDVNDSAFNLTSRFECFSTISEMDDHKLVLSSKSKSCALDPFLYGFLRFVLNPYYLS